MAYKPRVLTVPDGGTGQSTLTNHGILVGAGTTAITQLAAGSSGQVLQSGGASADPAYSTATYPATTTINQVLYSSAANTVTGLATANSAILATNSSGVPSITTASGNWKNTTRTCFEAYKTSNTANVTGDNTTYTIIFDGIQLDQASNFNTGTGVFTAPVAGNYLFNWMVNIYNLGAAHTGAFIAFNGAGGVYITNFVNPGASRELATTNNEYSFTGSIIIPMAATATAFVQVNVSGSTKTVGVQGGNLSPNAYSVFSGVLLC